MVTGACGFIGSHLVHFLDRAGYRVVAVDRRFPLPQWRAKLHNILFKHLDICRSDMLDDVMWRFRPKAVIHLAGTSGVRCTDRYGTTIDNNLSSTDALLRSMHRNGIRRLVFASSSSVYGQRHNSDCVCPANIGRPLSDYALSKQVCEAMCRAWQNNSDSNVIVLRLFTTYGPSARVSMAIPSFLRAIMANQPLLLNDSGRPMRDFVHVHDVCRAMIAALDAAGSRSGTYDVGTGKSTPIVNVANMIANMLSVSPVIHNRDADHRDMLVTCANVIPAAEELGFRTSVRLANGLLGATRWAIAAHS